MTDLQTVARSRTKADLTYESLYCAAIGGSVIALFFLVIDAWQGRPLFTPSLMGGVLFGGQAAETIQDVNMQWVGYATILHFVAFALLGTGIALAAHWAELRARHPATVLFVIFAVLEWAFIVGGYLALPGVVEVLGPWRVAGANLLAAGGIGAFLWANHQPEAWERFKHATHLA